MDYYNQSCYSSFDHDHSYQDPPYYPNPNLTPNDCWEPNNDCTSNSYPYPNIFYLDDPYPNKLYPYDSYYQDPDYEPNHYPQQS